MITIKVLKYEGDKFRYHYCEITPSPEGGEKLLTYVILPLPEGSTPESLVGTAFEVENEKDLMPMVYLLLDPPDNNNNNTE